jgi:hypothetical protein
MFDYSPDFEKISLKYPDDVPKGYDVSRMQYTFDFIYLVLKRDSRIDSAVRGVAMEYELPEMSLRNYLIEDKYILDNANMNDFSKQVKGYNTKSLKKMLKKHGLKTSGKRERIEKRIFESGLLGNSYRLSSKSKVFYRNKKRRVNIFNEHLSDYYYFDEFNEFYMDNYRKKKANIPIEFINIHIRKSVEDENHGSYALNNYILAEHFSKQKNYRKMLECVLRIFCMNVNPIWKIDELKDHGGIAVETYNTLLFLQDELGRNAVINTFYLIWDSFDFDRIIVPKYDAYRYLKDMLNGKDYSRINDSLVERFYSNDNLKIKKITQKTLFDF